MTEWKLCHARVATAAQAQAQLRHRIEAKSHPIRTRNSPILARNRPKSGALQRLKRSTQAKPSQRRAGHDESVGDGSGRNLGGACAAERGARDWAGRNWRCGSCRCWSCCCELQKWHRLRSGCTREAAGAAALAPALWRLPVADVEAALSAGRRRGGRGNAGDDVQRAAPGASGGGVGGGGGAEECAVAGAVPLLEGGFRALRRVTRHFLLRRAPIRDPHRRPGHSGAHEVLL